MITSPIRFPAFLAQSGESGKGEGLIDPDGELITLSHQFEALLRELYVWIRADSLRVMAAVAVGIAVYSALLLLRGWARRRCAAVRFGSWSWVALKVASRTRSFFLLMVVARLVTWATAAPPAWVAVAHFLFTIAAAVQGAFWARELLLSLVERRAAAPGQDSSTINSAVSILSLLINVVVWVIAGIILLDNLGVNVTALVAGLGIGGIAIGLAAQKVFSDLFAALAILLDQPFRKGDSIQVGGSQGVTGTVEHIGLKSTRLRAVSGELVVLSNANILDQQIANQTEYTRRRVAMTLMLTYQTPRVLLREIPDILRAIVERTPGCRFDRAHFVRIGQYSLDYELVFLVETTAQGEMLNAQQAVALAIIDRFAELGIAFAYPTQVEMQAGPDGRVIDPRPPAQS